MLKLRNLMLLILLGAVMALSGCGATSGGSGAPSSDFDGAWEVVGAAITGNAQFVDMAIMTGNVPCVIFTEGTGPSGVSSVKAFDGDDWVYLGTAGFIPNNWNQTIVADTDGMPAIAYMKTDGNGGEAVVQKYDGNNWNPIGSINGATILKANSPRLAFDSNNTPYLLYLDYSTYSGLQLATFDGGNWVSGNTNSFTDSNIGGNPSLITSPDTDEPFICYQYLTPSPSYEATEICSFSGGNRDIIIGGLEQSGAIIRFTSDSKLYMAYKEVTNLGYELLKISEVNQTTGLFSDTQTVHSDPFTDFDFVIDSNDVMYFGIVDDNDMITVWKHTDSAWVLVGDAAEIGPSVNSDMCLKVAPDGTVYVLYDKDNGATNSLVVVKYVP